MEHSTTPAVLMFATLALACAPRVSPSTTHPVAAPAASPLHRCTLFMERALGDGTSGLTLSGFGDSSAEASSQALLVAYESAELLDSGRIWAEVLMGVYSNEETLPWLRGVYASAPPSSGPLGWTFTPGECQELESVAGRVKVQWEAGQRLSVASDSAAMAIEGARRRSCHGEWATTFSQVFRALATADPANRDAMYQEGLSEQNEAFRTCVASGEYAVEASRHPRIGASREELCEVAATANEEKLFFGRAQGRSRAHALERASLMAIRSTLRATHAQLGEAIGNGEASMRAMLVARALQDAINAVSGQALVGNAHSRCSAVEGPLVAEWRPSDSRCGDGFADAPWSASVCDEVAATGRAHVVAAIAAADAEDVPRLLMNGFGEVQGCLLRCTTDVEVTGVGESVDTRRAHCDGEEDIWNIVERSVVAQSLTGLLHCADTALFGQVMAGHQQAPERFWEAVSAPREMFRVTVENGQYSLSQR
jgi:hypothetical protein